MTLSKSQYIRGLQCLKSLWFYKKKPEFMSQNNSSQETLFNIGYDVGDLAEELFPNGVEIQFNPNDFDGMIKQTQKLISEGCEVIYEASFKENAIFAMADILVKDIETNSWDIYEVKASTSVKDYYIEDASVQFYCLSNGIKNYEDIPSDFRLNKTQQIQVDSFKSNKVHIDKKIIRDFIKEIKYPINFFDFETFQNAIPRFDKQRPYM